MLTMISHNIEGLSSNFVYMNNMIMKWNPDVICMQETHLFSFQQDRIQKYVDCYDSLSKAVDDNDPIPMTNLPRAYGGTSTLWKKNFSQPILHKDGSNRIVVTQFQSIIIINVYMPDRSGYTIRDFQDEIEIISEICMKFQDNPIVIAGDLNVDITKKSDKRIRSFKQFALDNNFKEAHEIKENTYKSKDGKKQSRIDYILYNDKMRDLIYAVEYKVLTDDPLNCSTHDPLMIRFHLKEEIVTLETTDKKKWTPKPIWSKCDTDLYSKKIEEYLDTDVTPTSTDLAVDYLTDVITKVTEEVVPHTKQKRSAQPWSVEI